MPQICSRTPAQQLQSWLKQDSTGCLVFCKYHSEQFGNYHQVYNWCPRRYCEERSEHPENTQLANWRIPLSASPACFILSNEGCMLDCIVQQLSRLSRTTSPCPKYKLTVLDTCLVSWHPIWETESMCPNPLDGRENWIQVLRHSEQQLIV